jgi:hypothetical protein
MPIQARLLATLLAAIETGDLVVVCGAGLSRTQPSGVPSALELARLCARLFTQSTGLVVPDGADAHLEALASFFFGNPDFWRLFIEKLLNPGPFRKHPNAGHFAIADLLCCGALRFAVTTNFDELIETAAEDLGEPLLRPSLDGDHMQRQHAHRPLLKLHGCMRIDIDTTVWCRAQFNGASANPVIRDRLQSSTQWLRANLRGCHILIVGFWSDWPHLNDALYDALRDGAPASVTLVDISDDEHLQRNAPDLWRACELVGDNFKRVQASGASFLDDLRRQKSLRFFDRLLRASVQTYVELGGVNNDPTPALPEELGSDELYNLRRDVCGVGANEIVRDHAPSQGMRGVGATHLLVQDKGAVFSGPRYQTPAGVKVRIVNGLSDSFHRVKDRFSKGQPVSHTGEVVICVATIDDGGVPSNVARSSAVRPNDVVRASPAIEWLTYPQARERGLC